MIGVEKDDGVVRKTIGLQLAENLSHLPVHQRHLGIKGGHVRSDLRRVGIIGRQRNPLGIVSCFAGKGSISFFKLICFVARPALVRRHEIKHAEEGLASGALAPMRIRAGSIPKGPWGHKIIVLLDVVGAIVACFPHDLRIPFHARRQGHRAAQVLRSQTAGEDAGNEG